MMQEKTARKLNALILIALLFFVTACVIQPRSPSLRNIIRNNVFNTTTPGYYDLAVVDNLTASSTIVNNSFLGRGVYDIWGRNTYCVIGQTKNIYAPNASKPTAADCPPPIPPRPSGGGGGPISSEEPSGPSLMVVEVTEIPKDVTVGVNIQFVIVVNDRVYSARVTSIKKGESIVVFDDLNAVTLKKGLDENIDLNGDGKYDMVVNLEVVSDAYIVMSMKAFGKEKIKEAKEPSVELPSAPEAPKPELEKPAATAAYNKLPIIIAGAIAGMVILGAILFFIMRLRKKHD